MFHRAECNSSAQQLKTTCPQLWSFKIHPICRVSLLKKRKQLGFPNLLFCALPRTADRSHEHQAFHGCLWQAAQLLARATFSCRNRNGSNCLLSPGTLAQSREFYYQLLQCSRTFPSSADVPGIPSRTAGEEHQLTHAALLRSCSSIITRAQHNPAGQGSIWTACFPYTGLSRTSFEER